MKKLLKYSLLAVTLVTFSACCCSNQLIEAQDEPDTKVSQTETPPIDAYDIYDQMEKEGLTPVQVEQNLIAAESKLDSIADPKEKAELLLDISVYKIHLGNMCYENDYAKNHSDQYFYNEIGGNYIYQGKDLKEIMNKFPESGLADKAAFLLATIPLGGECEGYVPCYVNAALYSYTPFFKKYPDSPYIVNAINKVNETIKGIRESEDPLDEESLKDLYKGINEYYGILSNLNNSYAAEGLNELGLSLQYLNNKTYALKCFKQILDKYPDYEKITEVKETYESYK